VGRKVLGASQIALFVAPVLVLLSYCIGPTPMDLQLAWRGGDDAHRHPHCVARHEQRKIGVVHRVLVLMVYAISP
jgi:hypothetical protein